MDSLLIAVVTGIVSSVATVAGIKVEIRWLRQVQAEIKFQMQRLDERVSVLEKDKVN